MTSLALTVCAHIAATLYPPQFWPLIIGFCPFKPDTQPSICPTLCCAGGGGDGKGNGVGSGGYVICLAGGGGDGKGDGDGFGGYALGLAAGGGNGRYHALVLSGAEVNPPESLLVL